MNFLNLAFLDFYFQLQNTELHRFIRNIFLAFAFQQRGKKYKQIAFPFNPLDLSPVFFLMAPTENLHTPRLALRAENAFHLNFKDERQRTTTTAARGGKEVLGNGLRHLLSELMFFFSKVFTLFILTYFFFFWFYLAHKF